MITAIIQARLKSSRLPGKVMMDISGKPMLWHVINRVKRAKRVDEVIVATTNREEDKEILKLASETEVKGYTGSENDVLDRYYQAAKKFKVKHICRIVADCPLIDPEIIDIAAKKYLEGGFDYVSTAYPIATYPDGLDTDIFSFKALEKTWKEATLPSEKEHVSPYIWKNPEKFKICNLKNDKDLSYMRWTVDEECDLKFVREIYKRLYGKNKIFYMEDVLNLLKKHPELMDINKGIMRDEGYFKSLRKDKIVKSKEAKRK